MDDGFAVSSIDIENIIRTKLSLFKPLVPVSHVVPPFLALADFIVLIIAQDA